MIPNHPASRASAAGGVLVAALAMTVAFAPPARAQARIG